MVSDGPLWGCSDPELLIGNLVCKFQTDPCGVAARGPESTWQTKAVSDGPLWGCSLDDHEEKHAIATGFRRTLVGLQRIVRRPPLPVSRFQTDPWAVEALLIRWSVCLKRVSDGLLGG